MINKSLIVRSWLDYTISSDELKVYLEVAVVTTKSVVVELPQG